MLFPASHNRMTKQYNQKVAGNVDISIQQEIYFKELQTSNKHKKRGEKMQNIKCEVKDDKLIIEIDLTKEFGPSKSGKTITVASSRGNQKVEGTDVIIGLNVYKYPENR